MYLQVFLAFRSIHYLLPSLIGKRPQIRMIFVHISHTGVYVMHAAIYGPLVHKSSGTTSPDEQSNRICLLGIIVLHASFGENGSQQPCAIRAAI